MKKNLFTQSVEKKSLLLIFFVLFTLFISEYVFAEKEWIKEYVYVEWNAKENHIRILTKIYNYSYGSDYPSYNYVHAYLKRCYFEASANHEKYYSLMDISTDAQKMGDNTEVHLKNKLKKAQIQILNDIASSSFLTMWPDRLPKIIVKVHNIRQEAVVDLKWYLESTYRDVKFIRISGQWCIEGESPDKTFSKVIYSKDKLGQAALKSNTLCINTKEFSRDTAVKVYKDSEAVVIKGACFGEPIKIYTTLGAEIKSVISNNDLVKIELPAKQIYIVHIGKSRYKIAL